MIRVNTLFQVLPFTFKTTAGKNAELASCLFITKAVFKSIPFFRNFTSPLSKSIRHVITSLLPKGSP